MILPATDKVLLKVVAPVTAKVEERVVAPATVKVPEMEGESFKDRVTDDPKDTSPPPERLVPAVTVTLELDKAELGRLVKVLDDPERDLLVKVWVLSVPTRVVVTSGKVITLGAVGVQVKVPVEPVEGKTSWLEVADKFRVEKVGEEFVDTS